jgi:hypothetical protein
VGCRRILWPAVIGQFSVAGLHDHKALVIISLDVVDCVHLLNQHIRFHMNFRSNVRVNSRTCFSLIFLGGVYHAFEHVVVQVFG